MQSPSQVQGLAAPVPQAVVGWPAACQLTWRRRVQADYSLSGAHCLPAGAWSTRRQTAPHAPPPPKTQRHPSSAHATHTGTVVSFSRVCHRGVLGLSAVRHAMRPRQPGASNPVKSRRDGCADRGCGRPGGGGEGLTQTKPNPLFQNRKKCNCLQSHSSTVGTHANAQAFIIKAVAWQGAAAGFCAGFCTALLCSCTRIPRFSDNFSDAHGYLVSSDVGPW